MSEPEISKKILRVMDTVSVARHLCEGVHLALGGVEIGETDRRAMQSINDELAEKLRIVNKHLDELREESK